MVARRPDRAREALFPSIEPYDGWRDREDHILRNAFADFGVSVYGGVVAVWILERADGLYRDADWQTARSPRAQHWLRQIASRFEVEFGDYDASAIFARRERLSQTRPGMSLFI